MRRPDRRALLLTAAGIVLVVALAVIVAGQLWLRGERSADDREAEVRDAAEAAVTAVLSYDYRRLEEGVEDTMPLLTGDAEAQYEEVQRPLAASAPRLKAVVTAQVNAAAVLEADEESARVLLFVNQVSMSRKLAEPETDQSRVVVTMERHDGGWLVSALAAI